jgi:hypothetical protein
MKNDLTQEWDVRLINLLLIKSPGHFHGINGLFTSIAGKGNQAVSGYVITTKKSNSFGAAFEDDI